MGLTMAARTSNLIGLLLWISLTFHENVGATKCTYTKTVQKSVKAACSDFTKMMVDGYSFDQKSSGLDNLSDHDMQKHLEEAIRMAKPTPICVFSREFEETSQVCCSGWTGATCDIPLCDPSCNMKNSRSCVEPNICDCKPGYTGYRCDDKSKRPYALTWEHMGDHGGSHTMTKAFNAALTRTMFLLSDSWGISVGITVPLVIPPNPGRNTAIWFATVCSPRILAYIASSLHVWRPSYYPLPPVDAPGWGCRPRQGIAKKKLQDATMGYCYASQTCYGKKKANFNGKTVTRENCCNTRGGSWGISGTDQCVTCLENVELEPSTIIQSRNLPFRTCLNFGRSYFRMFDGLEYQFAGTCTYILAQNLALGWHVEMSVKNCSSWTTCRKLIKAYIEHGDSVETEQGEIRVNGRGVSVQQGKPLLTPAKSFTVSVIGEWVFLETAQGLRVKVDNASTVYVTLDKDKSAGQTVKGLCGNNNGNSNMADEFVDTTNPSTFGNSYKIATKNDQCPDSVSIQSFCASASSGVKRKAEEACSYMRSAVFQECHKLVDVNVWFSMCMNLYCASASVKDREDHEDVTCFYGEAYARECTSAGAIVQWRSTGICPQGREAAS